MMVFKLFINMTYDIIHSKTEDPIDQTIGSSVFEWQIIIV